MYLRASFRSYVNKKTEKPYNDGNPPDPHILTVNYCIWYIRTLRRRQFLASLLEKRQATMERYRWYGLINLHSHAPTALFPSYAYDIFVASCVVLDCVLCDHDSFLVSK